MSVTVNSSMSLDGYLALPDDSVGALHDWYGNGDVPLRSNAGHPFRVSAASAAYVQPVWDGIGTIVMGRRLFDLTDGWGGVPVAGDHVVVVTHRREPAEWRDRYPDAPFRFVDGVAPAIALARELAGDRTVAINAGTLAGQALDLGLVDVVCVDLVPVVFGAGRRFFGDLVGPAVLLHDPEIVAGDRVTHLRYRVRRPS